MNGRPILAIPEPSLINIKTTHLSHWQRVSKITQIVWEKWRIDYLHTLQQKSKWLIEKDSLTEGLMVVVREDFLPTCKWVLGRIQSHRGSDGRVRVVKVKTNSGEITRAISKIAVLPIEK